MSVQSTSVNVLNVAGGVGGVARAASDFASLFGAQAGSWAAALRPASYDGVRFGVIAGRTVAGRKQTIHDYPFRDSNWVEDLGKQARKFEITGFLVENDIALGSGGVTAQRDALLTACETKGAKTLTHPTLGTIKNVECIAVEISERADLGLAFEIRLILIVSGERQYPGQTTSTKDAVAAKASLTGIAAIKDYIQTAASAIQSGASIVQQAVSTAIGWYQFAVTAVNDARRIINSVSTLAGNFGTLFSGANTGYFGSNPTSSPNVTATDLLCQATAARALVAIDGVNLETAASNPADTATLAASIVALLNDLVASAINPADAVRLLSSMATYSPASSVIPGQIGTDMSAMNDALAALFRRYALAQLATTLTTYQPSSQNDANSVLSGAVSLFDAEITAAGDAGNDQSYQAVRALRQAVIADLTSRGADLSAIAAFGFNSNMPSLLLANRIYRDPTREPTLTQQINPIHPAFCPQTFQALAN